MISLQVSSDSQKKGVLFPEAIVMYGYEKGKGYVRVKEGENLEAKKGYWILLDQNQTYNIIGQSIQSYILPVYEDGWYMIGGCILEAQASGDNCNIGVIYGYEQGYGYKRFQGGEKLQSGKGYWILFENVTYPASLYVQGMMQ